MSQKDTIKGYIFVFGTLCISIIIMFLLYFKTTITVENIEPYSSINEVVTTITTSSTKTTTKYTISSITTSTYMTTYTTSSYLIEETTSVAPDDEIIVVTNYSIIVVPDDTTKTNILTTKQTEYETTTTLESTMSGKKVSPEPVTNGNNFVKTFGRGTYYSVADESKAYGGSGRSLYSCTTDPNVEIKGSIACRFVYEKYGYNYDGSRTIVYLDIPSHPQMTGFYYVDDCCASRDTIDFYYYRTSDCPFQYDGVIHNISCYIVRKDEIY